MLGHVPTILFDVVSWGALTKDATLLSKRLLTKEGESTARGHLDTILPAGMVFTQQATTLPTSVPLASCTSTRLPVGAVPVMLAPFAAGLVLYWTWNNLLSIIQQYYINKKNGAEVHLIPNIKRKFEGLGKLFGGGDNPDEPKQPPR